MINKIRTIEVSSNREIKRPYTGTNGCYVSVSLTDESINKLDLICKNLGFDLDTKTLLALHCTVMWSKTIPTSSTNLFIKNCQAVVSHVRWWEGHDKDGYLVLEVESPDLKELHTELVNRECVHSFDDYIPHVTLKSPCILSGPTRRFMRLFNDLAKGEPLFFEKPFI